eukprot:PLAT13983.3.p1 GENE.PLAT13983.3~~PLAT13983.3.p1  ORF type:complete len:243 (+),score=49.96 PLAT13983.3:221-949(+)
MEAEHDVTGGVVSPDELPEASDDKTRLLNAGAECELHLSELLCPCGKLFRSGDDAAICCGCGSATCSAACHKQYIQDAGLCMYTRNLIDPYRDRYQGCRCIRWADIKIAEAGIYLSTRCGSRHVECSMSEEPMVLSYRRGYAQYGNPCAETLAALVIVQPDVDKSTSTSRRCGCRCPACNKKPAHPVINCKESCYGWTFVAPVAPPSAPLPSTSALAGGGGGGSGGARRSAPPPPRVREASA